MTRTPAQRDELFPMMVKGRGRWAYRRAEQGGREGDHVTAHLGRSDDRPIVLRDLSVAFNCERSIVSISDAFSAVRNRRPSTHWTWDGSLPLIANRQLFAVKAEHPYVGQLEYTGSNVSHLRMQLGF
jgi:hypothetical protein